MGISLSKKNTSQNLKQEEKTSLAQNIKNSQKEKIHLPWQEFKKKAEDPHTEVIDIRTKEETDQGTLLNAKTDFDYYQYDFENKVAALDPNKTYLIYCRSGHRSGNALPIFKKYGLKVYDLAGGKNSVDKIKN